MTGPALAPPLPAGWAVEVDDDTRQLDEHLLFGGSPPRVLRLTDAGQATWHELRGGRADSLPARHLARTLSDAGMIHPCPPTTTGSLDVTVIIPVRDRLVMLERVLDALGRPFPVVVVDDASQDGPGVAAVCARHNARLLRSEHTRGPGPARNVALAHVHTEFIAFIDSDCVPPPDWIVRLAAHFADPLVSAAAPRLSALNAVTAAERYGSVCASLDLGPRPARVVPMSRISYVPTAALLVRTSALTAVTGHAGETVFDDRLRYGEDVDLVWRLHEAGGRIRYDPSVVVRHEEPATWPALLSRRFRYGTSAAPLALRHPASVAPLVVAPWSCTAAVALINRRPVTAAFAALISLCLLRRRLTAAAIPRQGMTKATGQAIGQTLLGLGRWSTQFAAPVLAAAFAVPGRRRSVLGRRLSIAALLLGPALQRWHQKRPALGVLAFVSAHIADDVAYGAGVISGCMRYRTTLPVRPRRARSVVTPLTLDRPGPP